MCTTKQFKTSGIVQSTMRLLYSIHIISLKIECNFKPKFSYYQLKPQVMFEKHIFFDDITQLEK